MLEIFVLGKGFFKSLVAFDVEQLELLEVHFQGTTQLDSHFLLLLEYYFVVLHIFFRVSLQVGSQLVEVKAIFICAFLAAEKELTKFGSAERCADQPLFVHELVHRQDGFGAISRVVEGYVSGVRRPSAATIVDIVGVDDDLFDFTVLAE